MKRLLLVLLMFATVGCTQQVSPGYIGMVMKPSGFTGEVLQPGRHAVYGRDRLTLIETKEENTGLQMNILCKDNLNFKFTLNVRTRLRATDSKSIVQLLNKQGAKIRDGVLGYDTIITTYVRPAADSITRGVVSKYETMQVRENRDEITKAIQKELERSLEGTPTELLMVTLSNFDYPDVITKAMETKKEREVQIEQEKAQQAIELLKADNKLKLAEKKKQVKVAEAEAEAAANLILGSSITPQFLKIKQLDNQKLLYEAIGPNDKFFLGANTMPLLNIPAGARQVSDK